MVCKMGCASALTVPNRCRSLCRCAHRHARGHRNSPPDCCYPDGLPCSSLSIIVEQKKQGKKPCFFIGADYETRPVRSCAHRHARGHRNSPPDCCYPGGLPCSSLSIIVEQKKQGKKPCFLYWSGLRDSNSLPPPWQGGALPDELNPQTIVLLYPAGAGLSSPFLPMGIKSAALLWA